MKAISTTFSFAKIRPYLFMAGALLFGLAAMHFLGGTALAQSILPNAGDNPVQELAPSGSLRELVLLIINFFLGFLALLAVVMIIYGGFLYISSGGEQEKIDSGKKILTYAIVGIIVIVVSFAVVNTLLRGLGSGTDAGAV